MGKLGSVVVVGVHPRKQRARAQVAVAEITLARQEYRGTCFSPSGFSKRSRSPCNTIPATRQSANTAHQPSGGRGGSFNGIGRRSTAAGTMTSQASPALYRSAARKLLPLGRDSRPETRPQPARASTGEGERTSWTRRPFALRKARWHELRNLRLAPSRRNPTRGNRTIGGCVLLLFLQPGAHQDVPRGPLQALHAPLLCPASRAGHGELPTMSWTRNTSSTPIPADWQASDSANHPARTPPVGISLDVGCATGDFLDAGREEGFDVEGLELSDWSCGIARGRGLTVHTRSRWPHSRTAAAPASTWFL